MPSPEFFFALECRVPGTSVEILSELASRFLACAGSSFEHVPELAVQLQRAAAAETGDGLCRVQFQAHDGRLDIRMSSSGGGTWHTSQPIP